MRVRARVRVLVRVWGVGVWGCGCVGVGCGGVGVWGCGGVGVWVCVGVCVCVGGSKLRRIPCESDLRIFAGTLGSWVACHETNLANWPAKYKRRRKPVRALFLC